MRSAYCNRIRKAMTLEGIMLVVGATVGAVV